MKKIEFMILGFLFIFKLNGIAQINTDCANLACFTSNFALLNTCEEFKTYATIKNLGTLNFSATATWDFGDGTPTITTVYPVGTFGPGPKTFYEEAAHTYTIPGVYVATLTVLGKNNVSTHCPVAQSTVYVVVSGACETCRTYSVLSTGYIPSTNQPIAVSATSSGGGDPNWMITDRYNLAPPSYTIISSSHVYYGTQPTVIFPAAGYCPIPPYGRSRFVSTGITNSAPNIYTYRRFFNMPSAMPTDSMYSLLMNVYANGYLYDISLNGSSFLTIGLPITNGMQFNITSCGGLFVGGSNYIDITVGDNSGGPTILDAEIMLYKCPLLAPCAGTAPSCTNCISSFAPSVGKKYLLSAWVKEVNPPQSKTSYTFPNITVTFPSISSSLGPFSPTGSIIDGWQRVEAEFTVPPTATDIGITLDCSSKDCYYDDIRILPFDGSMKSYVYDPTTLRLVAELDERNFATLYEYDEEGKLIRVKKETEKGKMTIKENRDNTKK